MSLSTHVARERVLTAALRVLSAERAEPHSSHAAEAEYADEQLALAARDLVRATDALDAEEQPVGWVEHPCGKREAHSPHTYLRVLPDRAVETTSCTGAPS